MGWLHMRVRHSVPPCLTCLLCCATLQVKELFEVEGELTPCSSAAMLACILGVLRDSHWCAAIKCPPEPLWAVPISVEVREACRHGCIILCNACCRSQCCFWTPTPHKCPCCALPLVLQMRTSACAAVEVAPGAASSSRIHEFDAAPCPLHLHLCVASSAPCRWRWVSTETLRWRPAAGRMRAESSSGWHSQRRRRGAGPRWALGG
jgi:hypothetical protein